MCPTVLVELQRGVCTSIKTLNYGYFLRSVSVMLQWSCAFRFKISLHFIIDPSSVWNLVDLWKSSGWISVHWRPGRFRFQAVISLRSVWVRWRTGLLLINGVISPRQKLRFLFNLGFTWIHQEWMVKWRLSPPESAQHELKDKEKYPKEKLEL